MARTVVIGGGFGGMATAARLAKLGHEVTLVEHRDRLGGAMGTIEEDGFTWDAGPSMTLLPGVVRDLFRKRSEEHTSELQSLMRISYAVFCLKKNISKQTRISR